MKLAIFQILSGLLTVLAVTVFGGGLFAFTLINLVLFPNCGYGGECFLIGW